MFVSNWGVSLEHGLGVSGACLYSWNTFVDCNPIDRPHAVAELVHKSVQSSAADQLFATREDRYLHDQSLVSIPKGHALEPELDTVDLMT